MMNSTHAHVSNLTWLATYTEHLWWFMNSHYHWLAHRFANRRHLTMWRHLSDLLNQLDWLMGHLPSPCPHGTICKLG